MFEEVQDPYAEVIARFDEMFERRNPSTTAESTALVDRVCMASRLENRAAAARLVAIGELFALRLNNCRETEDWAVDTMEAVTAEVAAALRTSQGMAASYLRYARALRERVPRVGALFAAGDIDFRMFATVVFRTDLITDPEVLAAVDGELAVAAPRWPSMTRGRLAAQVDRIVARADRDAVRRRREALRDRDVWIGDRIDGLSEIAGTMLTPHAHALDRRLNALSSTVCAADPRTRDQRRADALGVVATGGDRLVCECGQPGCPAAAKTAAPVVIHVVAEAATVQGAGDKDGSTVRADGLIPPELVAELAKSARLRPLIHPADASPEPGYTPSKALAEFVRCRDLTCRFPGCDRPAIECDIDHTIPFAEGGPTHASNLKCYCRTHHLVKTFWGWRDEQLPDGTVILTAPSGHTYVTTPGSALLFPALSAPTAEIAVGNQGTVRCGDRTAMMPKRLRTRAQNRAARVEAERRANRRPRAAANTPSSPWGTSAPLNDCDGDPPPF